MDERRRIAAIDCGTNSTRLLIVDERGRVLERAMQITRLGQGTDATGALAPEAIERCLITLRDYRALMDGHEVGAGRLVATSAVRDAANGADFLLPAHEITGLAPEVLTGDAEGRLSLAGATADMDPSDGPFLVVDIGGGSTEMVMGRSGDDPELVAVSMQLGCVRVTERFLTSDPPTVEELQAARAEIRRQIRAAVAAHPRLRDGASMLGLAGTVATMAALHGGVRDYRRELIHHTRLTRDDVSLWTRTLASEVAAARLDRAGMIEGRQDIIVGGALILEAVMDEFGFDVLVESESDILDGLVASEMVRR